MAFGESPQGDATPAKSAYGSAEGGFIDFSILDIRSTEIAHSIRDEIIAGLQPCDGKEKNMPSTLLYDEIGLKLFEALTFSDEVLAKYGARYQSRPRKFVLTICMQYYLTNVELDILQTWATEITKLIKPNSMIVELGSG